MLLAEGASRGKEALRPKEAHRRMLEPKVTYGLNGEMTTKSSIIVTVCLKTLEILLIKECTGTTYMYVLLIPTA